LIVIDASAAAAALAGDDAQGEAARSRLAADLDHHAPALVDLEVLSMVRRLLLVGTIDERRAARALDDLAGHALVRYPHVPLLRRIWELRHNLTPYDAVYVALAEALGAPLVTADSRLAQAPGPRCTIELLA
jgi:predicted nucleic acid-binding protein